MLIDWKETQTFIFYFPTILSICDEKNKSRKFGFFQTNNVLHLSHISESCGFLWLLLLYLVFHVDFNFFFFGIIFCLDGEKIEESIRKWKMQ